MTMSRYRLICKKHSHVLFAMRISLFSQSAVKTWDRSNRSMWIAITTIEM